MGVLLRGRAAGAPDSGLAESGERHCQRVSRPPPRNDDERATVCGTTAFAASSRNPRPRFRVFK